MASFEISLTYLLVLLVIASYCLFFGHLVFLCFSSIFCLDCFDKQKIAEDNNYLITRRNETSECTVWVENCEWNSKVLHKLNHQPNQRNTV